jgi:hypothetical protein
MEISNLDPANGERIRAWLAADREARQAEGGESHPLDGADAALNLAEEYDGEVERLRQQAVQDTFESWVDDRFGSDDVVEAIADMTPEEQHQVIAGLLAEFQNEHGDPDLQGFDAADADNLYADAQGNADADLPYAGPETA